MKSHRNRKQALAAMFVLAILTAGFFRIGPLLAVPETKPQASAEKMLLAPSTDDANRAVEMLLKEQYELRKAFLGDLNKKVAVIQAALDHATDPEERKKIIEEFRKGRLSAITEFELTDKAIQTEIEAVRRDSSAAGKK